MGYMRHHAILVTSYKDERINAAREKALSFGLACSEIIPSRTNVYFSFFVAPDGSKEGWPDSDEGDAKRDLFINWLNSYRFSDGSSPLDWVEVQYGDEGGEQEVLRSDSDIETGDDYTGPTLAD